MKLFTWLATIQGAYYLLTGIWPLIDIDSFMVVTGPKLDQWLVKMVGALVIPVGLVLLLAAYRKEPLVQTMVLALTSAIAFTSIDTYYSLKDRIWDVYLLDAAAQVIFIAGWVVFMLSKRNQKGKEYV